MRLRSRWMKLSYHMPFFLCLQRSFSLWHRHFSPSPPGLDIWLVLYLTPGQEVSHTPKKTHLFEDDPLDALDELVNIIAYVSMIVPWDSTTFGRDVEILLYLHQQDVRELASGREEINITLAQLWMMYMFGVNNKMGFDDVYGFIDPYMTHERNKFDEIQAYMTTFFAMGRTYIFFLIYLGVIDSYL
ncbi:hypothetical protein LR48_Vigan04g117600 [Vigna angularis]|uniref:Uncharacterized protein n=1 Tax=Phaseolus angularis TaxID=3914 RepID=A0A0L9UE24_PHAAN|nr:hypothetical protein LR48_Vigan04g117600 [Vigna angularis]